MPIGHVEEDEREEGEEGEEKGLSEGFITYTQMGYCGIQFNLILLERIKTLCIRQDYTP